MNYLRRYNIITIEEEWVTREYWPISLVSWIKRLVRSVKLLEPQLEGFPISRLDHIHNTVSNEVRDGVIELLDSVMTYLKAGGKLRILPAENEIINWPLRCLEDLYDDPLGQFLNKSIVKDIFDALDIANCRGPGSQCLYFNSTTGKIEIGLCYDKDKAETAILNYFSEHRTTGGEGLYLKDFLYIEQYDSPKIRREE